MARVGIDCDGVLADFDTGFVQMVNRLWPGRLKSTHHSQWDWSDVGLVKGEVDRVWHHIFATENWWMTINPFTDAIGSLARWFISNKHNDVWIVTSRGETEGMTVAMQTDFWLKNCGLTPIFNHLGIIPVPKGENKAIVYAVCGIDYSIDDKGDIVEECDLVRNHKSFLLSRPYNQDAKVLHRVKSVEEFLKQID